MQLKVRFTTLDVIIKGATKGVFNFFFTEIVHYK